MGLKIVALGDLVSRIFERSFFFFFLWGVKTLVFIGMLYPTRDLQILNVSTKIKLFFTVGLNVVITLTNLSFREMFSALI